MTLVRTLAVEISEFVVDHSSPGSKEWAEGLARESDFIESDWSAFFWSIGSLRVLLDHSPAPIRSTDDLLDAAKKFANSKRHGNATFIIMFGQTLIFTDRYFRAGGTQQRLGCILGVLGTMLLGIFVLLHRRQRKSLEGCDNVSLIQRYRDELQRVRNLPRTVTFWGMAIGFVSQCLGMVFSQQGGVHAHGWAWICSVLLVVVLFSFVQTQRNNRRRLEQIASLPGESF